MIYGEVTVCRWMQEYGDIVGLLNWKTRQRMLTKGQRAGGWAQRKSKQLSAAWKSPHGNRAHVTAHICFTLFFGLPTPTKRHFPYILVRESALRHAVVNKGGSPTKLLFSTYQVAWPTTSGLWEFLNLLHSIISVRNLHVNATQLVVGWIRCRVAMQVKGNPGKMYNYLVAQRSTFAKCSQLCRNMSVKSL